MSDTLSMNKGGDMNQSDEYISRADFWKKSADRQMNEVVMLASYGQDEAARVVLRNVCYCLHKATAWRVMGEALAGVAK